MRSAKASHTGTNGKGNRTRMDDATGYTTWAYDPRGRVTQEVKSITGAGVFTTGTTYDAADRVRTLTYPTGEVITNTYNARGLFNTLAGTSPYVNSTTYNVLGQVTAQAFGNGVTTNYAYNVANYRLQQIQVGALMDLRYAYDPVGNVTVMTNTTNSNQVASFGYDALDRLTSASTNAAGTGQYNETYAYNAVGNLTSKAGLAYTYPAAGQPRPHAATAAGSNSYTYDANGNMTWRTEAGTTYWQAWNADKHLDTVQYDGFAQYFDYDGDGKRTRTVTYLNGTPTLTDTFDTANSGTWTYNTYQTVPFNDGGQNVVRNVGTGANYDANFYRTAYSLSHGDSASVDFKVDVSDSIAHFALETSDGGTYSRWAMIANSGKLYVQYLVNAGAYNWVYPKDLINPVQLNTWYRLTLRVDDVNGFRIEVRERDGGAGSASYQLAMPAGKTWRFHHWAYRGTVLLDNYVERTDSKTVQVYPSALYERNVTAGTDASYYVAGSKRVAVRNNAGLYFIQGDHLGSNSLTTSITGTEVARTTYYPYGGTRTASGTAQTDRLFTDQRAEGAALGALYDYGARHYDSYLNRWLSPDSVVPDLTNPQSLNRYSYVRNNPLRYADPSGHCEECLKALNWLQVQLGNFTRWVGSLNPGAAACRDMVFGCPFGGWQPPSASDVLKQGAKRYELGNWGGLDPDQLRNIYVIADASERLLALNRQFGQRPDAIENSYEFATSSRQSQLEQFTKHYFGDIGFDVVYTNDFGSAHPGRFVKPGGTFQGTRYEKGAVVISESAFQGGWNEVGVTIFHEWLEQYRGELTHDEIFELEELWRQWFEQNQ